MDHRAQLKPKCLAQFAQVGQAAGPEGAIGVFCSSQKRMDQTLSVRENKVSCQTEREREREKRNPTIQELFSYFGRRTFVW